MILLAAFGTSEPSAIPSLLAVKHRVEDAFPNEDVALAFTSPTVRSIWHSRAGDGAFREAHPGIPPDLYSVPDVSSALASARGAVFLQSLHVADGAEFAALHAFSSPSVRVGAPALGVGDGGERALLRAAGALAPLVARASATGAALVLMAHGNKNLRQSVFSKFERVLRDRFHPRIFIGAVEAPFPAPDIVDAVKASSSSSSPFSSVLLAPLMLTAGEHALRDMAGDDASSWVSRFRAAGFAVECHLEGLGSNPSWADIYVEHLHSLPKEP